MRFYKQIIDGYITAIGTGDGGGDVISVEEYNNIMNIIHNVPHNEGKGYKLKTDLTWEEFDVEPIEEDEELSPEEIASILLGENEL